MASDNEVLEVLTNWLAEKIKTLQSTIDDGSCKDFTEYKERCASLRALRDTVEVILDTDRLKPGGENGSTQSS